jgi:putative ABC transport system ATP-binding protein
MAQSNTKIKQGKVIAEFLDVDKAYRTQAERITVLKKANLVIREGEFISILGLKGSGKTTLINCLMGLEKPDTGKIYLDEELTSNLDENERAELRGKEVSLITDDSTLFDVFTARENIEFALKTKEKIDIDTLADFLLLDKKLLDKLARRLTRLEKIKVQLAQAIINSPKLLLLDQAGSGLTFKDKEEFAAVLSRIQTERNIAIIITTDDIDIAMKAKKLWRLNEGKLS